ncbi:hypothetical protein PSDI105340_01000 [Pseudoalteromonas distincta]
MKLISAIVAISAVELLKVFNNSSVYPSHKLFWKVIIHVTFVISSALLALTNYLNSKAQSHHKDKIHKKAQVINLGFVVFIA